MIKQTILSFTQTQRQKQVYMTQILIMWLNQSIGRLWQNTKTSTEESGWNIDSTVEQT